MKNPYLYNPLILEDSIEITVIEENGKRDTFEDKIVSSVLLTSGNTNSIYYGLSSSKKKSYPYNLEYICYDLDYNIFSFKSYLVVKRIEQITLLNRKYKYSLATCNLCNKKDTILCDNECCMIKDKINTELLLLGDEVRIPVSFTSKNYYYDGIVNSVFFGEYSDSDKIYYGIKLISPNNSGKLSNRERKDIELIKIKSFTIHYDYCENCFIKNNCKVCRVNNFYNDFKKCKQLVIC